MELGLASSNTGSGGSKAVFIAIAVVIIVFGLLQVIKPELGWRMSRWQYKNRSALEPSSAGLMATRVGGAVAAVVGTVVLVIGLTH